MTKPALLLVVAISGCAVDDPELDVTTSDLDITQFTLPMLSDAERAAIVHRYDFVDPTDQVPRGLLEDTLVYFDTNLAHIPQTTYVVVVDFSKYSGKDRFWLVDVTTGVVEAHKVAHGDGSDPDNNGYADTFGNVDGSHKSSLGFYLTGEIYDGTHIHSMKLDGLSPDGSPNGMANTNVRERLIVMHEASYVSDANSGQQGRSNGCLALDPSIERHMVDRIHDGSLIYGAISSLAPPVGRARCGDGVCDGSETMASCPMDCTGEDPPTDDGNGSDGSGGDGAETKPGGCAAGGNAGWLLGLAMLGLVRRRR